jgi:hypothetical protein
LRSLTKFNPRGAERGALQHWLEGSALQFRFEFASWEFDHAHFEVNDLRGIFDRDFHEILFSLFKKREIFSSLEFQSADARAHQLRAANFKFEVA